MYQALRSLGIDTQLIIYPNENHGIQRPSYQRDRMERYLAWYDKYVKKSCRACEHFNCAISYSSSHASVCDVGSTHGLQGKLPLAQELSDTEYRDDALIVAGDVSDRLEIIRETLLLLRSKFRHLLFTPGNHELWVRNADIRFHREASTRSEPL